MKSEEWTVVKTLVWNRVKSFLVYSYKWACYCKRRQRLIMSNLEFVREDYIVAVKMEFRKDVGNFLSNKFFKSLNISLRSENFISSLFILMSS